MSNRPNEEVQAALNTMTREVLTNLIVNVLGDATLGKRNDVTSLLELLNAIDAKAVWAAADEAGHQGPVDCYPVLRGDGTLYVSGDSLTPDELSTHQDYIRLCTEESFVTVKFLEKVNAQLPDQKSRVSEVLTDDDLERLHQEAVDEVKADHALTKIDRPHLQLVGMGHEDRLALHNWPEVSVECALGDATHDDDESVRTE